VLRGDGATPEPETGFEVVASVEGAALSGTSLTKLTVAAGNATTFAKLRLPFIVASRRSLRLRFCAARLVDACVVRTIALASTVPPRALLVAPAVPAVMNTTQTVAAAVAVGAFDGSDFVPAAGLAGATATVAGSVPLNGTAVAALPAGVGAFSDLAFAEPSELLADQLLAVTFTAAWRDVNGRAAGDWVVSPLTAVAPASAARTAAQQLVVLVHQPLHLFRAPLWRGRLAAHFRTEPGRIAIRRVVAAAFDDTGASATRVELFVRPATTRGAVKASPRVLTAHLLAFRDTCDVPPGVAVTAVAGAGQHARCDRNQFAEAIEAARYCEAAEGRDARCRCFGPVFAALASVCRGDRLMLLLCSYVSACTNPAMQDICWNVTPSRALRVFFVVGGTAGAILLVAFAVVLSRRSTAMFRLPARLSGGDITMAKEGHDELFLT
jgi:hypothetical protein